MSDEKNIYVLLAEAQAEFGPIEKTKEGQIGNVKFKYAPLDKIFDATRPALTKRSISSTWQVEERENGLQVRCSLHYIEQRITCVVPIYHEGTMAGLGKSMTYARRYAYQCVTGTIAEEDTDASGMDADKQASRNQPQNPGPANGSARNQPPKEESNTDDALIAGAHKLFKEQCGNTVADFRAALDRIYVKRDDFKKFTAYEVAIRSAITFAEDKKMDPESIAAVKSMVDGIIELSQEVPA